MTDFDPSLPYNELPDLPPQDTDIETTEILKACISARVALAELKQAAELIPNSAVLVNALPLLEAINAGRVAGADLVNAGALPGFAEGGLVGARPARRGAGMFSPIQGPAGGGGMTVNQRIVIPDPASKETQQKVLSKSARGVRRASSRNLSV